MKISRLEMASFVAALRRERGYLETIVDANSVIFPKTLRHQFGQNYDVKKVRNKYVSRVNPKASEQYAFLIRWRNHAGEQNLD